LARLRTFQHDSGLFSIWCDRQPGVDITARVAHRLLGFEGLPFEDAFDMRGMAAKALRLLPWLRNVRLLRDWGVPSSVSPDEEPIIGWAGEVDNLFVAGRLHLNIATLPVVSELAAGMALAETVEPSLDAYSPRRFSPRVMN